MGEVRYAPPAPSRSWIGDIRHFFLHRPEVPTQIRFDTEEERENYSQRIMQRLGIDVHEYVILNIHKLGINVPVKYVFEELMKWDGDATCWPNHLAEVDRIDGRLDSIHLYPFGWRRYPFGWKRGIFGMEYIPLFDLNARRIQEIPLPDEFDNARYLLYDCSGGYPIGIFSMYVRSSIADQGEVEPTQLFLVVGFNFYGREDLSRKRLLNRFWEGIHNRVTANVMNRFKQLCEWRFHWIQENSRRAIRTAKIENPLKKE